MFDTDIVIVEGDHFPKVAYRTSDMLVDCPRQPGSSQPTRAQAAATTERRESVCNYSWLLCKVYEVECQELDLISWPTREALHEWLRDSSGSLPQVLGSVVAAVYSRMHVVLYGVYLTSGGKFVGLPVPVKLVLRSTADMAHVRYRDLQSVLNTFRIASSGQAPNKKFRKLYPLIVLPHWPLLW
ncbi:hypothetical protein BC629DRAFT_1434668 [Irpex lacteus]|nr:hypothetical protein BC629DRAFT_1434668 [Irpex lacteus]